MNNSKTTIALLLTHFFSVFGQDAGCDNCCGNETMLHVIAELCLEQTWCEKSEWTNGTHGATSLNGTKYENGSFIRIFPEERFKVVRRCAVQNFEKLESINGENTGIELIDSEAFWHLPGLKSLYFAFNLLKEVQFGVFSDLPATMLDLSWNEINFISENAFKGMKNLKILNLTHNKLTEFDIFYTPILLDELILSHNFLIGVKLRTDNDFGVLDLSFNRLTYFTIFYLRKYGKIDLTYNNLISFTWGGGKVEDLRLSLNYLTDMEPLVGNKRNVSTLMLFPNPWKCEQLDTYYRELLKNNVTILDPEVDKRLNFFQNPYPVCALSNFRAREKYDGIRKNFIKDTGISCADDKGCPNFMMCRTNQCWDPCQHNPCRNKNCVTSNHKYSCRCPRGMLDNNLQLFSPCHNTSIMTRDCSVSGSTRLATNVIIFVYITKFAYHLL